MLDHSLQHEIQKHLAPYPGAAKFIVDYSVYCHAIDDLIDRDNPTVKDYKVLVLDCFALAADVFSCGFYQQNLCWLYPIVKNTHRIYQDAVLWEKSDVQWQREQADVLRGCGNEIVVAILEHLCHLPYADIRRISLALRENAYIHHHTEEGKPE